MLVPADTFSGKLLGWAQGGEGKEILPDAHEQPAIFPAAQVADSGQEPNVLWQVEEMVAAAHLNSAPPPRAAGRLHGAKLALLAPYDG